MPSIHLISITVLLLIEKTNHQSKLLQHCSNKEPLPALIDWEPRLWHSPCLSLPCQTCYKWLEQMFRVPVVNMLEVNVRPLPTTETP